MGPSLKAYTDSENTTWKKIAPYAYHGYQHNPQCDFDLTPWLYDGVLFSYFPLYRPTTTHSTENPFNWYPGDLVNSQFQWLVRLLVLPALHARRQRGNDIKLPSEELARQPVLFAAEARDLPPAQVGNKYGTL